MKLSIIIPLYNSANVIEVTLDAVYSSKVSFPYEVIIVDDLSPDNGPQLVKEKYLTNPDIAAKTKLILKPKNDGFGITNNVGMKEAKGDYILLLNSDTKVDPDNFETMVNFMESRPDVGIATCKLVLKNGEIDKPSRRSEPNLVRSFFRLFGFQALFPKLFGAYNMLNSDPKVESELEACSGAYMIMPRRVFEITGGFDERYFMYAEDLDLCREVREAGMKIWWYPKTTCMHFRGQSTKKTPQRLLYAFYEANWIYYKKWYSKKYWHLMDLPVYIANWGLYYFKSLQNYFRKEKYVSKS